MVATPGRLDVLVGLRLEENIWNTHHGPNPVIPCDSQVQSFNNGDSLNMALTKIQKASNLLPGPSQ